MRITKLAAAAALVFTSSVAIAAAPIECSFDEVSAATRATLGKTFVASLADRSVQPEEAELIALKTAVDSCATRHNWTESQKKASFFHAFSRVLVDAVGQELSREGIAPATVERAYLSISLKDRRALFGDQLSDEGVQLVLSSAEKQGVALDTERKVTLYSAMMAGIDQREDALEAFGAR